MPPHRPLFASASHFSEFLGELRQLLSPTEASFFGVLHLKALRLCLHVFSSGCEK